MSDDITFCTADCSKKECIRNQKNICDFTIPHSFADMSRTDECMMTVINIHLAKGALDKKRRKKKHE